MDKTTQDKKNKQKALVKQWMFVQEFLKANSTRTAAHKNMLMKYLHNYFQFSENEFYPIYVESDIRFKHPKHGPIIYPGLIVRTGAHSTRCYQVALFEKDNANICDLHD